MIELSEQLAALDARNPEAAGTPVVHYSPAKDGPFHCDVCIWYKPQTPSKGLCDHPKVLEDPKMRLVDDGAFAQVDAHGCCEYERKRQVQLVELSDILSEANPRVIHWQGITIAVENRKGETRHGRILPADYGYFPGALGLDGMWLDCFLGDRDRADIDSYSDCVHIIRMHTDKPSGEEDKILLNFPTEESAKASFSSYYGEESIASVRSMPIADFREWLSLQGGQVSLSDVKGKPIAFDLDGTLFKRIKHEHDRVGKPIHKTFAVIEEWRKRGYDPYVLTARTELDFLVNALKAEGLTIKVTNVKQPGTLAVVDDRAVDVENHDFRSIMEQIEQKVNLSERSKVNRDTVSPFWDAPVHAAEAHVDFRSIQSHMVNQENGLGTLLTGGLRVNVTRDLASQAVSQLARGKRAHELKFTAPPDIRKKATPRVLETYRGAANEANKEAARIVAQRNPVALQETDAEHRRKEEAAMLALLALLEDRYVNFLAGAMREAATSEGEQITQEIASGDATAAEAHLEAFANKYSSSKLESLAGQVTREAVRAGRGDEFALNPVLAGSKWYRSALLDDRCCDPCTRLDMTRIPSPDYDLSKDCLGDMACRCLPVTTVEDRIV